MKRLEEPYIESNEIARSQSAVKIDHELSEKMLIQSSHHESRNEEHKYANPNALGLLGLVLGLSPLSCVLMGLEGATTADGLIGPIYGSGALALIVGAVMQFMRGDTFSLIVFMSFGGLFISLGITSTPSASGQSSFGDDLAPFLVSLGFYYMFWAILAFLFLVASLKINVIFCWIFITTDVAFALISASYFSDAQGQHDRAKGYRKAAGAMAFLTIIGGWYGLAGLIMQSVDFPWNPPAGDLSRLWVKKRVAQNGRV